jgi:hypothetical protein
MVYQHQQPETSRWHMPLDLLVLMPVSFTTVIRSLVVLCCPTRVRDRRPHLRQPDLVQRARKYVQGGARCRQPVAQRLVVPPSLGEQPSVALLQILRWEAGPGRRSLIFFLISLR